MHKLACTNVTKKKKYVVHISTLFNCTCFIVFSVSYKTKEFILLMKSAPGHTLIVLKPIYLVEVEVCPCFPMEGHILCDL